MKEFVGKNTSFKAFWDCNKQYYRIYKDGKYLRTVWSFREVKPYLD